MAAQAVMYLPIYVAQQKGIFDTMLSDCGARVIIHDTNGDFDAINEMNIVNYNTDQDSFAIAIADPYAINNETVENARIIGALIDRLSFWGVSMNTIDCHKKRGIEKSVFSKVVYYDDNLITGHRIGRAVRIKADIKEEKLITTLGEEFDYLEEEKTMIITPDLLAIALSYVNKKAHINYHFAKGDIYMPSDYLTTAIMTSEWCLDNNPNVTKILVRVIEAIQKAKSIIYSSKQIAKEILMNMDVQGIKTIADVEKKNAVADFIINIINEDRIYPSDMNISENQWESTFPNHDMNFSNYVNNDIVLQAEKSIASQFGITIDETFAEEIEQRMSPLQENLNTKDITITELNAKIVELETTLKRMSNSPLKRFTVWVVRKWFHLVFWPLLVYTIVWFISFLYGFDWAKYDLSKGFAVVCCIPVIINVLTGGWRKKSNG